jgi:L-seryl-tRNA(Ser) seleniumtransferase
VALPAALAGPLRTGGLPVVGRVEGGVLLLDLLALDPGDDDRLATAVKTALAGG